MRIWAYQCTFPFVAAVFLLSCDTPGERAQTGECPAGEECSELTPDGLYFRGPPVAGLEAGLRVTAAEGTQTVTALIGEGEDREPFDHPFAASIDEPFELGSVDAPSLELVAEDAGSANLRLADEETGELFDLDISLCR